MIRFLHGDCRDVLKTLPDQSVQCVVTSPPYYGLRQYLSEGHADSGLEIGSEPTPDAYVAAMVDVFREVWRVLRDDGTAWVNIGDSYANDTKWGGVGGKHVQALHGETGIGRGKKTTGLKPKDLLMIPARVAIAIQADGWFLRSSLPWVKRSSMPESATDRPTSAVEYVFLLTKKAHYFYDGEAIKRGEVMKPQRRLTPRNENPNTKFDGQPAHRRPDGEHGGGTRSFRNTDLFFDSLDAPHGAITDDDGNIIALDVNPGGFSDVHFATFPPKLIEPLIKAGTSEKGCCPACGSPWERTITKGEPDAAHRALCGADTTGGYNGKSTKGHDAAGVQNASDVKRRILEGMRLKTYGWQQTCDCPAATPIPCTVLDPFSGAGTTALVSDRLGRSAIGIDLSADYGGLARDRLIKDAGLFAEISA